MQSLKYIYQNLCQLNCLKKENEVSQLPGSLCYLFIYDCSFMVCLFVDNGFFNTIQIKSSIGNQCRGYDTSVKVHVTAISPNRRHNYSKDIKIVKKLPLVILVGAEFNFNI